MVDDNNITSVAQYCHDKLNLSNIVLGDEYYYSSMPLCVIDSVFSIGVRYEGVTNTVNRVCTRYEIKPTRVDKNSIPENQKSTSDFLDLFSAHSTEFLISDIFKNKQWTSTRHGIRKVDAIIQFLKVLKAFGIEYFQDVPSVVDNAKFDKRIEEIPGQRSGISLKYYFMLAGSDDLIKPDRMMQRFLYSATGVDFSLQDCQTVMTGATDKLNKQGYVLTARLVDYAIWQYQRKLKGGNRKKSFS